jgi:hypothetical protein
MLSICKGKKLFFFVDRLFMDNRFFWKAGGVVMLGMEELKIHREIVDRIDWEMTPEKAVETYLEWGTGWTRKDDFVRYPGQEALYFVIYDWEKPAQVTLIRRTMKEADEIAKIPAPPEMVSKACEDSGHKPGVGVHALSDELKAWLKEALGC